MIHAPFDTFRTVPSPVSLQTSSTIVKAGIIAAGEGSRLRSEGISLPKPLVTVDGVPLIERLIRSFIRYGITEIVCIVNERSLEVKQFVEGQRFTIPIQFVVKTTPSSMHSLFELSPHLMGGQFLLSTVDSVFSEEEFSKFLEYAHHRGSVDGILAVTNFVDDENPLYVQVDKRMRIAGFGSSFESIPEEQQDSLPKGIPSGRDDTRVRWVTGGLYVLSPRIFKEIDAVLKQKIERLRNFFGHLLKNGYTLEGYPFSKIVDVDHVHDVQTAEELLKNLESRHGV
ncbi:MAG: NTP transferase domain-containing protein [Ignavibacteria bacterium]|nr:NTP transferase domain-containing protein [Ignavibacteria bacterium]MBI3766094.1 NTP transferase domain-containing protein [Ignavibacteriales bacterium]